MEALKLWLFKRYMRELIVRGDIIVVFKLAREICEHEFPEDNATTHDKYILDAVMMSNRAS